MTRPAQASAEPAAPADIHALGLARIFQRLGASGHDMRERAGRVRALAARFEASDFVVQCEALRRSVIGART